MPPPPSIAGGGFFTRFLHLPLSINGQIDSDERRRSIDRESREHYASLIRGGIDQDREWKLDVLVIPVWRPVKVD
jgi:hypothetical protein